jgi:hypothetical protein
MNERIKRLAREAGLEFDDDLVLEPEPIYYTPQKDLEKFAELIVRECAEICLEANDHKNILRHFGVEQDVNETLRNRSTYFGNDI